MLIFSRGSKAAVYLLAEEMFDRFVSGTKGVRMEEDGESGESQEEGSEGSRE